MGAPRVDVRIILKYIFTQKDVEVYTVVNGSELCPQANWCKYANITFGNKEDGVNRDKLNGY